MSRLTMSTHPKRVREAAEALLNKGLRPTVQRVRAMLGGGSPNVIAPILKEWRETLTPEQQLRLPLAESPNQRTELPLVVSDLAAELWKRAIVFATIECNGSPQALQLATMSEESEQLRTSNRTLMDQLEKGNSDNISLREQLAQLQAVTKVALDRATASEDRCASALSELRLAKQTLTMARRNRTAKALVARKVSRRGRKLAAFRTNIKRRKIDGVSTIRSPTKHRMQSTKLRTTKK